MKWTTNKPESASWRWWLPHVHPFIVLIHASGQVKMFGGRQAGPLLHTVVGLWSDEALMPDVDCFFLQPETTGYFWFELIVGQAPVIVSVFQPDKEKEPMVSIIGIPEHVPLSKCQGRWSKENLKPPTEIAITNGGENLK